MKTLKYTVYSILLAIAGLTLYGVERYGSYEAKQEEVRTFKQFAFKGYTAVNTGDYDKAVEYYEAAIAIHDKDDASLSDLASAYRKKGRIEEARTFYEKAYGANKDAYKHLYNAALCDYLLNNYDAAIEKTTELIHQDKKRSKYYRLLAVNHFAKGENATAFGQYAILVQRKSYQKDDLLSEVRRAYEALAEKPEPQELIFAYEQTDSLARLADLMQRYEKKGYDIKALRTAEKILGLKAGHDEAHKTAARLFYEHDVMNEAHRHASAVREHDARSLEILGGTHQNFGEHDKALEAYERSYAKAPKKELLRAMAVCAFYAKKSEDMENYLERLSVVDPRLAHRVVYALETKSGVEHTTMDKLSYLIKDDLLALYCDMKGCDDA